MRLLLVPFCVEVEDKVAISHSISQQLIVIEPHSRFRREMDQSQGRLVNFRLLYLVTQLVGIILLILIGAWIGIHLKGFGWDYEQPKILFNWHPILMTVGMVFLYGNCECLKNNVFLNEFSHFLNNFHNFSQSLQGGPHKTSLFRMLALKNVTNRGFYEIKPTF